MATLTVGYDSDGNALDYTTIAAAQAAASDYDTLELHFATTGQGLGFAEFLTITKPLNFTNGIKSLSLRPVTRRLTFAYVHSGTVTISDIAFNEPTFDCRINFSAGSSGEIIFERCYFMGSTFRVSAVNGAKVMCKSCVSSDYLLAFDNATASQSDCVLYNCFARNGYIDNCECYNCLVLSRNAFNPNSFNSCTGDYNASPNGGPGANSITIDLTSGDDYYKPETQIGYRTKSTSTLVGSGTTGAAFPSTDFYGNSFVDDTIGADAGVFIETDRANVLVSAGGTFDEAARNTDPGQANVKDAVDYKIQDVDLTGSYVCPAISPGAPTLATVTAGDGQLTLAVTPATGEAATPIHAYVWQSGGSVTLSTENRTGAGDLVLTGLTNNTAYTVQAVHVSGDVVGKPSKAISARPTDGSEGKLSQLIDAVYDIIDGAAFSETVTAVKEYPPPFDVFRMQTIHAYVTGRDDPFEIDSRDEDKLNYTIDIQVFRATDRQSDVDLNPISKIVEEMRVMFRQNNIVEDTEWLSTQSLPYEEDEGVKFRLIGKLLTLTYESYG
jgi:hypothetical protein